MITGDNRRVTAACDQYGNATGHTNISTQNQITYFHVTSSCRITMDSYLKEGKYYCEGCLELVKDSPICSPRMLSNETANIVIHGKPVFNHWISVARLNGTTIAEIVTQVCANPNPQIYWTISGRKIIENKTVDNFYAHSRVENTTYPNCYNMVLEIDPLSIANECESYVLVAINNHSGDNGVKKLLDVRDKEMPLCHTIAPTISSADEGLSSSTPTNDGGRTRIYYIVAILVLALVLVIGLVFAVVMIFCIIKKRKLEAGAGQADEKNQITQNAPMQKETELETPSRVVDNVKFGVNNMPGRSYDKSGSLSVRHTNRL